MSERRSASTFFLGLLKSYSSSRPFDERMLDISAQAWHHDGA